jgi:hypothetical protein
LLCSPVSVLARSTSAVYLLCDLCLCPMSACSVSALSLLYLRHASDLPFLICKFRFSFETFSLHLSSTSLLCVYSGLLCCPASRLICLHISLACSSPCFML